MEAVTICNQRSTDVSTAHNKRKKQAKETTAITLRLKRKRELEELADQLGESQSQVADRAIGELHAKRAEEAQERTKRAITLLAELRRRVGDLGIEDGQGIGYSNSGPIAVQVGDTTYVQHDDGTITADRTVAGRSEMALVGEDGIDGWMATAPAEPALN